MIILSSLDQSLSVKAKQEIGHCDVLQKPVRSEQLRRSLSRLLQGHQSESASSSVDRPQSFKSSARVLIAEDNMTNQLIVKSMLKHSGAQLEFANDGQSAVKKYQSMAPDLVMMDMSMPVKDGVDATIDIRNFEAANGLLRCPIVALTANAMKEDQERCFAAGMDGFLSKPIVKDELLTAIDTWAQSKSSYSDRHP